MGQLDNVSFSDPSGLESPLWPASLGEYCADFGILKDAEAGPGVLTGHPWPEQPQSRRERYNLSGNTWVVVVVDQQAIFS